MKRVLLAVIVALVIGVGIVIATNQDSEKSSDTSDASHDMSAMDMPENNNTSTTENSTATGATTEATQTSTVTIKNFAFGPTNITVKKGTTVTWTNQDTVQHDVRPDKPTDEFKQSDMLNKGESYSVTFNTVGTFSYFCSPHPYMKAQVTVTE